MLAQLGLKSVHAVSGGQEAIDYCTENRVELMLLDCNMPGIDGFETAKRIHEDQHVKTPVIVACTAVSASDISMNKIKFSIFDDVVCKPCNLQTLQQVLHKHGILKET